MTANKNRKQLIRQRARRTNESYSSALRHLSAKWDKEQTMDAVRWRRIEKPAYGYAVRVPEEWEERPPDLKNSRWETARFIEPEDHRHGCPVFRQPARPRTSPAQVADGAKAALEAEGFGEFGQREIVIAGRPGVELRFARRDAGRVWGVREHFIVEADIVFCLAIGTSIPEEDAELVASIVQGFELLASDRGKEKR